MYVTSPDGGNLQIKMPKTILDSMIETEEEEKGNVTGSKFTVLIDGVKTKFEEIKQQQKDTTKEISVFIPKGDKKVEIIGKDIS